MRRGRFALQLNRQVVVHGQAEFVRCRAHRLPTYLGVGTEDLAFDEGDPPMAKTRKMIEGQARSAAVIQRNICDPGQMLVSRNRDDGHGNSCLVERVYKDETFDGALLQQTRILVDQIVAVAVADDKIKIAFLKKVVFDARENKRCVAFTDFGYDHSNRKAALLTQHPRHDVWAIIQFASRRTNPRLCVVGN